MNDIAKAFSDAKIVVKRIPAQMRGCRKEAIKKFYLVVNNKKHWFTVIATSDLIMPSPEGFVENNIRYSFDIIEGKNPYEDGVYGYLWDLIFSQIDSTELRKMAKMSEEDLAFANMQRHKSMKEYMKEKFGSSEDYPYGK